MRLVIHKIKICYINSDIENKNKTWHQKYKTWAGEKNGEFWNELKFKLLSTKNRLL